MRIISGKYRGRILKSPVSNKVRPTADRAKEAIFSSLEAMVGINGISFLDAFCGSGAIGIEAMSRGADDVYLMDIDTKLARDNASSYKDESIKILTGDVLNPLQSNKAMDVVFIDPPYQMQAGSKSIKSLIDAGWANEETLFVVETDKDDESIVADEYSMCDVKKYGNTVVYYVMV